MLLKLFENPSKIEQKTTPDRWKCVLGAFSAPNRAQVGSRTLPGGKSHRILAPLGLKMSFQGSFLGPSKGPCEHIKGALLQNIPPKRPLRAYYGSSFTKYQKRKRPLREYLATPFIIYIYYC